jgi:hypothetical protein
MFAEQTLMPSLFEADSNAKWKAGGDVPFPQTPVNHEDEAVVERESRRGGWGEWRIPPGLLPGVQIMLKETWY